jgi:hypothetical protein
VNYERERTRKKAAVGDLRYCHRTVKTVRTVGLETFPRSTLPTINTLDTTVSVAC